MIRLSERDKETQEWVDQQLQEGRTYEGYSYYKDMGKVKLLQAIHEDIKSAAENAKDAFQKAIPLYPDIEIKFAKSIGGPHAVARYISNSAVNVPIVLIGVDAIVKYLKQEAKSSSLDTSPQGITNFMRDEIYPAIEGSIYHELGHAMVDEYRDYGWESDAYTDEEDFVEDFARDMRDGGDISPGMRQIISDIQRLRNGEELEESQGEAR